MIDTRCTRRSFLKKTVVCSSAMSLAPLSIRSWSAQEPKALIDSFVNPPSLARPFYRWWWNGNRVTAKEIRRELLLMKEKGAGGVEINPIALDEELYPHLPAKPLDWLSKEWLDMVKVACKEAKSLDMYVDLIVGTGWPFGGKFLLPEETIQGVELEVRDCKGPGTFETRIEIPNDDNHKLVQLKLFPAVPQSESDGLDVMDQLSSSGKLQIELEDGEYKLYIVTWRNRFRDVLHGAPGADGPVLDHFNKSAVEKYLNRMSDELKSVLGDDLGAHIRSMFCDSIELKGANWTGDLPDEFKKRYAYSLMPWLPLLLNLEVTVKDDFKEKLDRVRYDMSKLLADLFMERFIQPFHQWCGQNNVQSRYQAYGVPFLYTDLLDGYLVPDIPESDQWLFNRGWVHEAEIDQIRYAIWNKYASSGVHLTGKKITSCEAMTNTIGVFRATLEYIKQATDLNIICGVNQLVLHGFNYSPPEAGFPGWIRYGTYFNENNTWWPFAGLWFDYAARLCHIFQNSAPVTQIAILGNTPDKWSKYGLDRNPWNTEPHYLHQLWQAFNHFGYMSDYINSTVMENAIFERGELRYGPMAYKLLLVTDVSSLSPKTVEALQFFAASGGQIVFIGQVPVRSLGYNGTMQDDEFVKSTIEQLFAQYPGMVKRVPAPEKGQVIPWALHTIQGMRLVPDVLFTVPDEKLFFIHHAEGDNDIFLISNQNRDKRLEFDASFSTGKKIPWKLDAETGEIKRYPHGMLPEIINVKLGPLESLLVVYKPEAEPAESKKGVDAIFSNQFIDKDFFTIKDPEQFFEIDKSWSVELKHVNGKVYHKSLKDLKDLSLDPELSSFSGTAVYTCKFKSGWSGKCILDLGQVYDIAEPELDGKGLGVKWWGERQFVVELLPNTEHVLQISVTNLLFNYCASLKDNKIAQLWVDRTKRTEPEPAGLLGPVRIYKIKS